MNRLWAAAIAAAVSVLAAPDMCFAKGDAAAYEKSVADLTQGQPLSNRPNELSFLIETGQRWCADKAVSKQRGTFEERQIWLAKLRQTEPDFQPLTSGEGIAQDAAVEQADKLLCP